MIQKEIRELPVQSAIYNDDLFALDSDESNQTGTPGTASTTITKTITKTGYTPIAVKIRYVSNSIIGFNAFFNSDNATLYVQVIRRQTGASSPGYKAYADVTYIKT